MSGFVVDSRTLLAVRDTLDRLHGQLTSLHTVIWHQWGTLGGNALESELEHFCGTWHYGVTELGGQLQDLTRRLGEASDAYERIEQRITNASGGSGSTGGASVHPTGSGHTSTSAHHPAKHTSSAHHIVKHSDAKHHSDPGGVGGAGSKHYSGGAGLGPVPAGGGSSGHRGDKHSGGDKHGGADKHGAGDTHPGVGSGTTVIGGGPGDCGGSDHKGGSDHGGGGAKHNGNSGSGTGTTVIGGGSGGSGGSGTTTIDEKIHHAEDRQRAELASVLNMVKD